ncbi:hypothetical protein NXS19_013145 [Fusarium pseudograminearum]|nr:hypothetical protein NXS19_013145 [Fusarium pseudograminearum]
MDEESYPFFAYGTLRALPLLAHILTGDSNNTHIVTRIIAPSRVHGYSRWAIRNNCSAAAVKDSHGSMDGLLLYLSKDQRERLESLRGPLFDTTHVMVSLNVGMNLGADMWVFRGAGEMLSNKPWSFDDFCHDVLPHCIPMGPTDTEPSRRRA